MRLIIPFVVSLVALLLLPAAAQAQVINACVKKNGSLRIVGDPVGCKASETPLSWNQDGPQGEPGPAGEPGVGGEPGSDAEVLHVFDVSGRSLGLAGMAEPETVWVYVPGIGETKARRDGGINALPVLVYYTGAGCTGDPFVAQIDDDTAGQIVTPDGTRFLVVETEVPVSELQHEAVRGPSGSCDRSGGSQLGIPATEITPEDLGLPWPGPLYVGLPSE